MTNTPSAAQSPAIEIRDLTRTFGRGDNRVTAVDDIDLQIGRGEIVSLLGPNGAGKTTSTAAVALAPRKARQRNFSSTLYGVDALRQLRNPYTLIFTLVMPVGMYLLFGGAMPYATENEASSHCEIPVRWAQSSSSSSSRS